MTRAAAAALASAVLLLGGCHAEPSPGSGSPPPSTAAATRSQVVDAREAAATAAEVLLSHDHRTLSTDEAAATALMTPAYATTFRGSFAKVRAQAERDQSSSRTVARQTAIVAATGKVVRVLAFADQTTSRPDRQPVVLRLAPVLTMTRTPHGWLVSDVATGAAAEEGALPPGQAAPVEHAAATATAYLTFGWSTIQRDLAAVQALVGGELASQYADRAAELAAAVQAHRTVQQGRVLAVGVQESDAGHATVLVSAAVTLRHEATGVQEPRQVRRLQLHLVRSATGWRTTRLQVLD